MEDVTGRPLLVRYPRAAETATVAVALLSGIAGAVNYIALGEPWGLVAIALALAGLALVGRWPWPGLALAAAAPLAGSWLGSDPLVPWSMAVFIVLVAALRGLPALPIGTLAGLSAYGSVVLHDRQGWLEPLALLAFVVALAFAFIGASLRTNQRYWAAVANQADEALATREAEAERRVAEERLRIAHDLHDTLGHEVALVSLSVGAAEVHLDTDPAAARGDLAQARERIQRVLAETQRTLAVLRDKNETVPAADFGQIPRLVEECRAAGMEVEAVIAAEPSGLDPETSAAAYRIVQEALVNARKHGAGAVRVHISVTVGTINIEVVNRRGPAPGRPGGGFGLVGMRERAASTGGRIDVDADETLFTLRAGLPVKGRPA